MKVLICSEWSDWLDGALRLQAEGHDVVMWIGDKKYWDVGDGFVEKVRGRWQTKMSWADLIIFDDTGFGKYESELKANGKKYIGCNKYVETLEKDRKKGSAFFDSVGIKCPKSFEVQTPEELIAQIKKKPGRYVIKPHNSEDKTMSCVGKMDDGEDIIAIMESIISKGQDGEAKGMRVEEHVEGVEIGISGYFNGKKFLSPYIINFEHKKLMDGNVGPNTGEMGTSAVILKKAGKLEQELKKCEPKLAEVGYTGAFDLEFIVNEKGAYCLEPTSRFGYPSIFLHTEALNGELGEFMMGLADGSAEESPFKTECVVGVVMVTPPFPFENAEIFKNEYEGMPILGLTDEIIPHVHFCGVKEKEDKATLAGQMGYVLVVTGSGSTMKEAKKATYDIVEEIIIPDVMYRTDISDRWAKDLPKLQKWGYL